MDGIHDIGAIEDIEAVVFDVLGTLVDEPTGLRAEISDAVPAAADAPLDELVAMWRQHTEREQECVRQGHRAYASTEVIDAEAAQRVAAYAGITDPATVARLATAGQRLPAWHDSAAGLDRIAQGLPVLGVSNAGRTALLRLNAHAGLRWHQALSGEAVQTYKPAPEVYRFAIDTAGCAPDRILMVAAHAWDLRAAQKSGMRTAYIHRPSGDPPTASDAFDRRFNGLDDLATALMAD